jgi:hypothetical protein
MKQITVEFTGAAREISGERKIRLELSDQGSYQDIVNMLARRFPGLVGTLISADKRSLLSANLFNRNGEEPIMPEQMSDSPRDGERIVLLYFIVGG